MTDGGGDGVVLFFLFLLLLGTTSAETLRGVAREDVERYLSNEKGMFRCLDESADVPFSFVNDDYCDCRDGSDEPGTSACANGHFACHQGGKRVFSSRVNDGICDCCDGSDEYARAVVCTNLCEGGDDDAPMAPQASPTPEPGQIGDMPSFAFSWGLVGWSVPTSAFFVVLCFTWRSLRRRMRKTHGS